MVKTSQLLKSNYKPKDIAEFLGVTTRTLQNWDRDGKSPSVETLFPIGVF